MNYHKTVTLLILALVLAVSAGTALAEDDEREGDSHEGGAPPAAPAPVVTTRIVEVQQTAPSQELLDTLDYLMNELTALRSQQGAQEDAVLSMAAEIQALRDYQSYQNATIAYMISRNSRMESQLGSSLGNLTLFGDDDGDGVINRDDLYPGENDRMKVDSDGDGVVDFYDRFNGLNDLDFQDKDGDGVRDSQDSDITRDTDLDNDGIDDAYDTRDDRPLVTKLFYMLGLIVG